mgnify:FL=1
MNKLEQLSPPSSLAATDTQIRLAAVPTESVADPVVLRIAIVPTATASESFLMRIWQPLAMVCGLLVLVVILPISLIGHYFADARDFISRRHRANSHCQPDD